ncbi:hypothetical protein TNCV_3501731 [Trichonephila clavipes]|uniref:Uncharacterized protein n=1 Tax=Trichonephila clavipes TaxID=2585209 RepID=A0A8X6RX49_TRICX|nr:hypothetical protein TNCV_3501731 [Trichonephila clavipes]
MQDCDDQQPSEKDIVQPEDISNAPTEKGLENVGYEFENYTLTWPKSLSNNFIEMSYFQNKDPNNIYSVSVREYKEQKRPFSNNHLIKNGQVLEKSWLGYSTSIGSVFCLTCKLFSETNSQYTAGFSDSKHVTVIGNSC